MSDLREVYITTDRSIAKTYFQKALMDAHVSRMDNANKLRIKKVIFNDPATIIIWQDGSKTVVKCSENETYDPEKGMAMAIAKKALGNSGNYYNEFKKWLPKEEKKPLMDWFKEPGFFQKCVYTLLFGTGEEDDG